MATKTICRKCREPIDNHCAVDPINVPEHCSCYKGRGWHDVKISDICVHKYPEHPGASSYEAVCRICGHNMQCHDNANGMA